MKRSPLVRRTPLLRSSLTSRASLVRIDTPATPKPAKRRTARKIASDKAMAAIRPALIERAGGYDEVTGEPFDGLFAPHAHHRLKRLGQDRDVLSNLLLVNARTHGWIHHEVTISRRFHWILRSFQDPIATPVYRRGKWVHLLDSGAIEPTANPNGEH